jgi:hypothetical protein
MPRALPWAGGCLPCFVHDPLSVARGTLPCVAGQVLRYCTAVPGDPRTYAVCQPCTGPLPYAFQAWTSEAPFFTQCRADCEVRASRPEEREDLIITIIILLIII